MKEEDQIALGMLALKHAMDRIKPAQDELRARANKLLKKKQRVPVEIDGETVGVITKSSPGKRAYVNASGEFLAWMREHYADDVWPIPFIENMPKALAFLEEHAPHLVQYRDEVDESVVRSVLSYSETAGQPVGPGGELDVPGIVVDTPDGNTSVIPDKDNAYLIEALWRDGLVGLDGTARKQIGGTDG